MSKVKDTLFGDNGKAASKAQAKQNASERQFMLDQSEKAKAELQNIFPQLNRNAMTGANAAANILRGSVPAQTNIASQGAQNAMAAILGGQINPYNVDMSFLNQQIPDFAGQVAQAQPAPQTQVNLQPIAAQQARNLLRGQF